MNIKKNRIIIIFLIFIAILLFYCIFSTKIGFTDTAEYIGAAKEFAGLNINNIYIYHSIAYSFILGLFLRIWPSMIFLKIINSLWLVLIAFLLYKISNNKKALILWILCPLGYYMSVFISPILASGFFLFLAYYLLKKYENTDKIKYFIFSALSLGLVPVFRLANLVLVGFFIVVFLFNKKFNKVLLYLFFCLVTFSTSFILSAYYYGIPFYTNALIIIGLYTEAAGIGLGFNAAGLNQGILSWLNIKWLIPLFLIAPLWFLMFRKENKKEIIFVILSFLFPAIAMHNVVHYRYLFAIAPFIILLLSKTLKKKWFIINNIIALVIIVILTSNYFGVNENTILKDDLINLEKDFEEKVFVTSDGDVYFFPALYWNDFHYIWLKDYMAHTQKNPLYSKYTVRSNPTIKDYKTIEVDVNLYQNKDPILDKVSDKDLLFIFKKAEIYGYDENTGILIIGWFRERIELLDMKKIKCYDIICVFKKY